MATIDSVKLPDNSTYDLTDNYSGYAKKVAGATTDDLASLTATGDLADSGKKLSDLVLKSDVKDVLNSTSTTDPLSANMGRVLGENVEAIVDVYGAKNLLPYPFYETTKSENAVTFTDNGDGSVTVSGTASADTNFIFRNSDGILKKGTYIFSGCPSGGTISTYRMLIYENGNFISDFGNGTTFTIGSDVSDATIFISIKSGTAITTPIIFKPMIYDARITDPTFTPYAKTNQQLTADKAERADLATLNLTGSTNSTGSTINAGTFFYLNGSYCKAKTAIANGATFTLNTNFEVVTVGGELENKLNLVKVAESASGTDTFRNKLNALYNAFNALSDFEKTLSFIVSYGTGVTPMKFVFGFDKRFGSITRQDASITSGSFITLDSSNSVFSDTAFNTNNTITATDNSTNSTPRQFYLYTLR